MKVSVVLGTRPEGIKLAPVIKGLKSDSRFECRVCSTGQHREMLKQIFDVFDIRPDVDLGLMQPNQTLAEITSRAIVALDCYLEQEKPDVVMVQGDTTTVFAGAIAAFYHKIPIAHVEAGLRTGNIYSPWPEEANRQITTRLSHWHFAPTSSNRDNLICEGVPADRIFVTGNTVIDALMIAKDKVPNLTQARKSVLITGHRRENFGRGFENICEAIKQLVYIFPDVDFIYPVHLNPNVRGPVERILAPLEKHVENLHLVQPLGYLPFVNLMKSSYLVLTDSGGVQEEAPSLGKPVLVMRDTTERPEAVAAGTVRLVGTDKSEIIRWVSTLLNDKTAYSKMASVQNPYGDGWATMRILDGLLK